MTILFVGLTTPDTLHRLDHALGLSLKVISVELTMAAGGPATNATATRAVLCAVSRVVSGPEDETGAASGAPTNSKETPILLTTLGEGPVSAFLATDLATADVRAVDAATPASPPVSRGLAVPSITEHPSGRMVVFMNARPNADAGCVTIDLPEWVGTALIDGRNLALTYATLTLGIPKVDGEDPFAPLEACLPYPRILDGGSWKEWLTPLLGPVDIVIASEGFAPPLMVRPDGAQVAGFLRGFSTTRTVRTRGDRTMQYQWDGTSGEIPVEAAPDASMLRTNNVFHGAFVWAIERDGDTDLERLIRLASPVVAVSTSSFSTRQWLTSRTPVELAHG